MTTPGRWGLAWARVPSRARVWGASEMPRQAGVDSQIDSQHGDTGRHAPARPGRERASGRYETAGDGML
jgi:hypothetical protein